MDKKELKAILSNFSPNAGGQIKYYFVKSLFPNITDAELKDICGLNPRSFSDIKKVVTEKDFPLLKLDNCAAATLDPDQKDATPQVDNAAELQLKLDKLNEELAAAYATITRLSDEMEEKNMIYRKSLSGYQEENLELRRTAAYWEGELKKRRIIECPAEQARYDEMENPVIKDPAVLETIAKYGRPRTPPPVFSADDDI